MPINNQSWFAIVGLLNNRLTKWNKNEIFLSYLSNNLSKRLTYILSHLRSAYQLYSFLLISVVLYCLCIKNFLLLKTGDIKSNPGPRKSSVCKFCRCNLNGLAAYKFTKLSLIEGYINVNDIDIIYIIRNVSLFSIPIHDSSLSIPGHLIMRADHLILRVSQ